MGIFYNPPPPPTANNAGTPPEPHVRIGTQGNQPPRRTTALMMAVVLMSWPQDLEPRLARPNDQRQKIAPLTLTYGRQPPPSGPVTVLEYAQLVGSWPTDVGPLIPRPNDQRQKIAPLTLVYGSPPAPQPALSVLELRQLIAPWEQTWAAQAPPKSAAWNVPPILSVVPYRPLAGQILAAWEPPWIAPPIPVEIAPLTLTYGAQPPPQPALSIIELQAIVATWVQTWNAQTAPKNAAWNVPPIPSPVAYAPIPRSIWSAWEPPWIQPPRPVSVVTLTLPTGMAPPLTRAELSRQLAAAVAAWTPDAPAPPALLRSTVFAVLLAQPPNTELPALIWRAWEEPFVSPPGRVSIAPLTLVYGAQPRPQSPLAHQKLLAAVASWVQDWGAQTGQKNAAWVNFVPATSGLKLIIFTGEQLLEVRISDEGLVVRAFTDDSLIVPAFTDEGLIE